MGVAARPGTVLGPHSVVYPAGMAVQTASCLTPSCRPFHCVDALDSPGSKETRIMRPIRVSKVLSLTALKPTSLARLEEAGKFPRRRHLSSRVVVWDEEAVLRWI